MKTNKVQVIGAIFTLILGTLLHFTYNWSGENRLVGMFSAVNESTWEHLKLLFTPMLIFGVMEYFLYGRKIANFIPIRAISIAVGMAAIVVSFYSYVGIVGQNFLWADIGTFFIGVIAAYIFSAKYLNSKHFTSGTANILGWILIFILLFSFCFFTFYPPKIGLFLDVGKNKYGI